LLLAAVLPGPVLAAGLLLDFPTANHELAERRPADFYQYVDRTFGGEKTQPWEGGQFGFVRDPRTIGGATVHTRHHEGIDIKPLRRDPSGNPLDPILAAAAGTVVYANRAPAGSNYGRYVVVEHVADGARYYSLYAHLATIAVAEGERVAQGQTLGIMGYSGRGLDRTRAHLHFEFALLMSENFDGWHHEVTRGDANPHGNYNGQNLAGINPADLLLAVREDPTTFDLGRFLRDQPLYYKIAIPASANFTLPRRYPWMLAGANRNPPTWVVSFTQFGVPVRVEPSAVAVAEPQVVFVRDSRVPYSRATKNIITGSAGRPVLSESGRSLVALLTQPPFDPQ
jgi:murein DD-endopeptidase MepM/ murein hydrolase activator NlpD